MAFIHTSPHFLRHLFGVFLKSRRARQLFRSRFLFESLPTEKAARVLPETLARSLQHDACDDLDTVFARLQSRKEGLSDTDADAIRKRLGPNEINHEKPVPWLLHLWLSYKNPFNLLLSVLALVSWITADIRAATVIGSMVMLSTVMRFVQERRSNLAALSLKEMVSNNATVRRLDVSKQHPESIEIAVKLLVPGDIILLAAGDMVPADCRIFAARDLFINQSAMTGESLPVEKFPVVAAAGERPLEMKNLAFMGTNVVSGSATALVLATGNHTYFGALATRVTANAQEVTAFQMGVNAVSWLLIRFALVMVPLVLLINGVTKGNWSEALLFSLSIAVGLTPEMLPMIVTSTLAKGAVMLSHKKVIVKRLDAIQNFGAMNVLCTDKTGTLTQDKVALARHTDVFGAESELVLEFAYLNSFYQTGLKNLLDHAVLEHTEVHEQLALAQNYQKIDEIPFDFQRRRMSVVVSEREHHHELICKGAVEETMSVCTRVRDGDKDAPLDAAMLERVVRVTRELNQAGLRVVAVAMKELPLSQVVYSVADESELTLIGYIAFLDPPKESTAPALKALTEIGVAIKVLTGDNELVSAEVCRQVGLAVTGIVMGTDIEAMDDQALGRAVEGSNLFAKLSPSNKERIVRALRSNGDVVGFMGDGINDAPALRAADIGISVDTAVDIAKEAADIILLERSLMVVAEGVREAGAMLFQSGWFVVGLLTQTLVVHMIRTPKIPFITSCASKSLLATTLLIMVIGIFLPMGPMAPYFQLQVLPAAFFVWLVAILLSYGFAATLMKRFYIYRFGWQ